MKLETFQYRKDKGWSIDSFPNMDSEQTLILVLAAPQFIHNSAPIQELFQHYPNSKMLGCSTAGEILGAQITDESISVAVAQFEKTTIKIVKAEVNKVEDSFKAGEEVAKLLDRPDLKGILVLSDGLKVNGTELVNGLNKTVSKDVIITGGLAGDGDKFKKTWIVYDGQIYENSVVAIGLYGEAVHIGFASQGGWEMFGPERLITRSQNNILYELDGQPALTLYKKYLGERAKGLPSTGLLFPLAIRKDYKDPAHLVRTILAVDEKEQSLIFAGDMPTGYLAQLMKANFDRLVASAGQAGEEIAKQIESQKNGPLLSIAISCVGRRLLLGERTEEETEFVLEALPSTAQQVGFYSYGELSPYVVGTCELHNQTMTLTIVSEK
jgi:hypothetical protein